jgi:hypothetical protein
VLAGTANPTYLHSLRNPTGHESQLATIAGRSRFYGFEVDTLLESSIEDLTEGEFSEEHQQVAMKRDESTSLLYSPSVLKTERRLAPVRKSL